MLNLDGYDDSNVIMEAEYITVKGCYFGKLIIDPTWLVFESEGKQHPAEDKYVFGALVSIFI
jgi:hypothetical protein